MAIVRLALANPAANIDTLLHTATRQSLVSVVATNKSASAGTLRIWVQPQGATSASGYVYLAYDTILPISNSLETFRFALETYDQLYVRSSISDVSFSINAIHEQSGNQNIVTVGTDAPSGPNIGDVWVNTNTTVVSFWNGTSWVSAVGGSAGYIQTSEPGFPNNAAVWVDKDDTGSSNLQYPNIIYSPTQPTGLGPTDAGTIWVDEDSATLYETVVPAIFYSSSSPTGLNANDIGYMWVNPNENLIEYNMNDYVTKNELAQTDFGFNQFLLAGM